MRQVRYDKTESRNILASMNDFALSAKIFLYRGDFEYLNDLDVRLSDTPCGPLKYHTPIDRTLALFNINEN